MHGVHLFVVLLALPALAAFGHDLYLFYAHYGLDSVAHDIDGVIEQKGPLSFFASLGFIWTQYHAESYKWVVENTDADTWAQINIFLTHKAVFVALALAGVFYAILGLLGILGLWPFGTDRRVTKSDGVTRSTADILGKDTSKGLKYKRK